MHADSEAHEETDVTCCTLLLQLIMPTSALSGMPGRRVGGERDRVRTSRRSMFVRLSADTATHLIRKRGLDRRLTEALRIASG
jgi:hypothetical protein